jgi:hypothetical protein
MTVKEVSQCDFCGELAECRDFARQTNPQYGVWCRNCYDRWLVEGAFEPMAYGGMLSTGWGDEDDEAEEGN